MKKYIDLIAFPIMIGVVYALMGLARWNNNPEHWEHADRVVWIIWGLVWGYALQCRIKRGGE